MHMCFYRDIPVGTITGDPTYAKVKPLFDKCDTYLLTPKLMLSQKVRMCTISVILVKIEIKFFRIVTGNLDVGLRRYNDFLRDHQN